MESKVRLNYEKFPEVIQSGVIKLNEDQSIKISSSEENEVVIEIRDNAFGASYLNSFVLDYDTAKNFYNILYQMLKQLNGTVKVV